MRIIFGHIPNYPPGTLFESRRALRNAGVHRHHQKGICGGEKQGADSIVLSEAYEDDEDSEDEIVYTGQGGRDDTTGAQIAHQTMTRGNLALVYSEEHDLPVRVIRRINPYVPAHRGMNFRYDGLYRVVDHWQETGKSGFQIWRYRLVRIQD